MPSEFRAEEEDMAGHTRTPRAELTGVYGAIVKRMSCEKPTPPEPADEPAFPGFSGSCAVSAA
jgi:hypothetical protein